VKTNLSEIGRGMTPNQLLTAYQAAELEISNVRHLLLWAAERLPLEHRKDLAQRLNRSLVEGGVTVDPSEDKSVEDREFLNTIDSILLSFERTLKVGQMPHNALFMGRLIDNAKKQIAKLRQPSLAFHRIQR
jgi:hypothetical protein